MSGTMLEQLSAIAVRVETTPGTDAIGGTPLAADQVFGTFSPALNPQVVEDPSLTGTLDAAADFITGTRPTIEITVPLRGSGTAGTAPAWAALLRACGMVETVQASAITATAAAAGTTTTATLTTPYAATAQLYRGLPAILTGNPTGPVISPITDYTVGRVASFGETFGAALSTSTLVALPVNVAWRPTSDLSAMAATTIYLYRGGYRWMFTGARGSVRLEMPTGGVPRLVFAMQGQLAGQGAVVMPPALLASPQLQPPVFLSGRAQLMRGIAKTATITFDLGNTLTLPPNPEALEGVDPALITGRATTVTLDPQIDTTAQEALWSSFRAGTTGPLVATCGTVAGNRFAVTMPSVRRVQMDPGARERLGINSIRAQAAAPDAGLILAQF